MTDFEIMGPYAIALLMSIGALCAFVWGVLSGATTNPSLLAKEDGDPGEIIRRICELVRGPVSAEVVSDDADGMIAEGRALAQIDEHIVVKVPFSAAGLAATRALSAEGIRINMTLVFSANQALLSAEAGATYISCFMGRLDDISVDSTAVLREIVETLRGLDTDGLTPRQALDVLADLKKKLT